MTVFFTSDTHFGDHRVLNLYPRPFGSVAEMDAGLVARWNAAVGPDDVVWHLGDFARTLRTAEAILPQLNGVKHLVLGNNDPPGVGDLGWASVGPYAEIEVGGVRLVLCHYPFRSWNGMARGSLNLHGHSHGRLKPLKRQFDVGVDARGMAPVSVETLMAETTRQGSHLTHRKVDASAPKAKHRPPRLRGQR
jgi:calcineurin-like phosphoesterase family protein